MTKKTHGLGRGLDSLFPGMEDSGLNIQEISIGDLDPNPDQPRQTFDDESISQLADSIRDQGVRPVPDCCRGTPLPRGTRGGAGHPALHCEGHRRDPPDGNRAD